MIKFFRKIRQRLLTENRISKYLLYALGETLLVVIGILIALQVNNWNESRKNLNQESILLVKVLEDINTDSLTLQRNLNVFKSIDSLHLKLYKIGIKNDTFIILNQSGLMRRLPFYNPVTLKNNPALLNDISNENIRKEALNYFQGIELMNETFQEYHTIVVDRIRPYLGQRGLYKLEAHFEGSFPPSVDEIINNEKLAGLSKQTDFQQLLFEANLKLKDNIHLLTQLIESNSELKNTVENEITTGYHQ